MGETAQNTEAKPPKRSLGSMLRIALLIVSLVITVVVIVYCVERGNDGKEPFEKSKKEKLEIPEPPEAAQEKTWRFIVSGDSRNCGDIVVPAIATHSANYQPAFYWHLGDLRYIYEVDEDIAYALDNPDGPKISCKNYLKKAWPDFVKHQMYAFNKTPLYLGIGNHEVVPPKGFPPAKPQNIQPETNSAQFTSFFADWLLPPAVKAQRVIDHDCDKILASPCVISARNYYHWIQGKVDFIYLDNASNVFGQDQLDWFKATIKRTRKNHEVRTVIVGMHEALPDSISSDHAMCDEGKKQDPTYPYDKSCREGREAYKLLLDFQNDFPDRQVYVLASHSHYVMDGIFKMEKTASADRLHGWIAGTAGAVRYKLPPDADLANYAETNVYGYLVGTVDGKGNVRFDFQKVSESDVPPETHHRYQPAFVNWCFAHNTQVADQKERSEAAKPTPTPAYPITGDCNKISAEDLSEK
jgi:hypothetical protein